MRLIDAEKAKEVVKERLKDEDIVASSLVYWVISKIIDEQPTAYDVDKVVEEIYEQSYFDCDEEYHDNGYCIIDTDKAIDIVKRGGINENNSNHV